MLQSFLSCLGIQHVRQSQLQISPPPSPAWLTKRNLHEDSQSPAPDEVEVRCTNEKSSCIDTPTTTISTTTTEQQATTFLETLLHAETPSQIQFVLEFNGVSTLSLKEYFAKLVLSGLETTIRNGVVVGKAMADALERAVAAAVGFVKEHPVYCTLIALGVLVVLAPWVLELLGFAELGPIEGKS